jgi:hypothetical protein
MKYIKNNSILCFLRNRIFEKDARYWMLDDARAWCAIPNN